MESLKKLDEVCKNDVRHDSLVRRDPGHPSGWRTRTLEDFHRMAEEIILHEGVPEDVRNHFTTARNLIIYSWFYYPFNVTAAFMACVTVEYALREKTGDRKSPFKTLMMRAVDKGWIADKGFSIPTDRLEGIRHYNATAHPLFQLPEPPLVREYTDILASAIPLLRNSLAHGTPLLANFGASQVRICAELINQLFEPPNPQS